MRYNSSELKHMALRSQKNCTKEGILSLREKEGKLWNKTDVLTERWCRLVDNLLFYFKTKDPTSEPYGVFVLEGSQVRLAESDSTHGSSFVLEFDGDSRSTYFLADRPSDARDWVNAISNSSYTKLKLKYERLQKKIKELEGEDGASTSESSTSHSIETSKSGNNSPTTSCKISPGAHSMTLSDFEQAENMTQTPKHKVRKVLPQDSVLPVLEVFLQCTDLTIAKTIEHKRCIQMQVLLAQPPVAYWKPVQNTEYVKSATSVQFSSTLSLYQCQTITFATGLRFHLCQMKENNTVDSLGSVSCSVSELINADGPLNFNIENNGNHIGKFKPVVLGNYLTADISKSSSEGTLSMATLNTDKALAETLETQIEMKYGDLSQIPNLKTIFNGAISRTYRFPTSSDENISVQEVMLETRLSFHIPLLYLKSLIDQETRLLSALNSIKHLRADLEIIKARQIAEKKALIESYQNNVKHIVVQNNSGTFFKPSINKTDKDLEFVPTNLHLQRMIVQHSEYFSVTMETPDSGNSSVSNGGVYDVVTVGAATAHAMKFKQGGLYSLMQNSSEKLKKSKEHVLSSILKHDKSIPGMWNLSNQIDILYNETKVLLDSMNDQVAVAQQTESIPERNTIETCLSNISNKTCMLVNLLDDNELCRAIDELVEETSGSKATESLAANLAAGSSSAWDDLKSSVKTTLSGLIKSTHSFLDASPNPLVALDNADTSNPPSYDQFLNHINLLCNKLMKVLTVAHQGQAIFMMQASQYNSNLQYRRDVVFSQALATCVSGVATKLCSSLGDKKFMSDIVNHGILIQFESLLSTYGNEMGMLEDYIVGAQDLAAVEFQCVRAEQTNRELFDRLLPTLHGTRHKLIVKLHMDGNTFDQLSNDLKSGKKFKVVPVMFNVGINEEQTLADKFGKTALQEYINMESYSQLTKYCHCFSNADTKDHGASKRDDITNNVLGQLGEVLYSKKNKKVEILHFAAQICHRMNGIRVTSCKSAKDRTAMAVTLEQIQILTRNHELSPSMFSPALASMRCEGTRRENTRKNVGVRKYAFTSVQLMTFPKQYRPPDGTYGKADT